MNKQKTIAREIMYSGIGLHSGAEVKMKLSPAPVDTGIVFIRTDLPNKPRIKAIASNVTSTLRATTIGDGEIKVFTIEHLMSALFASDIDNCYIELDNEEPPVVDGASEVFVKLLSEAGSVEQDKMRQEIVIKKVYRIDDKERFVMVVPYDGFRVSFTSLNPHPLIGTQYYDFTFDIDAYKQEIAPARTIAYEKEVEALHKMGLGLGGNLENVIVYNDEGWMNKLRYADELVRHKILDIIGDLRLAGVLKAHVIAVKSGHELNTKLAKKILADFVK
ncbi:UDP-3-O-acyl-N-acetylglucosamine deacetylase [Megamonas hypermegale]|uniref:UDP-3-O-acyl-N-acetylglucosamine deacetylase n=1 Tax=Megamonas hypermegale TaxID=158847 RepID=A0A239TBK1_9FIRM|nr:UDP-3-O-acyl-N-acetylglucosamine deacetylase [Megamonas hypermegale]MBM6833004.1 UDP-3-O-[3-hydroxymyristoyl] N-acetylglucosamine deacetylase [Megamonas hypermegale]SNU94334.1 UDP-3-O-[3-hydroxymyristoyl] N-acetylglucosamine deacetylase [Megamonas hypermegale]